VSLTVCLLVVLPSTNLTHSRILRCTDRQTDRRDDDDDDTDALSKHCVSCDDVVMTDEQQQQQQQAGGCRADRTAPYRSVTI